MQGSNEVDRGALRRPVVELAAEVRAGRLGARELVAASLAAIEAADGDLAAFVCVDGERAMADAAAVDEQVARGEDPGPLAGIPLAVKDTEDAAGFPTTDGSAWRRGRPPATSDSIMVARLRAAGCVVVGKTNTPEMAWKGDTTNGWGQTTRNPWDRERTAGGSSGGSAAAVAAGLVPLATASDGGGSIRIPAAACGLPGFKPSLGRIPSGPEAPGWLDLSSKGVLTRTVADAVAALDVVVAPDPSDLRALPQPDTPWLRSLGELGAPRKVAWSPDLGYGTVDPEVAAGCAWAVERLADLGAEIEEVPALFDRDPAVDWFTMVSACNARSLAEVRDTPAWEQVDPGLAAAAEYGANVSAVDLVRTFDAAHELNLKLVEVFHRCSVLVAPTVSGPLPPAGSEDPWWVQLTYPFNLTRSPAGSVPVGLTSDGLPIALQVVGPQHADVAVLRCMALLESAMGFDPTPPRYA